VLSRLLKWNCEGPPVPPAQHEHAVYDEVEWYVLCCTNAPLDLFEVGKKLPRFPALLQGDLTGSHLNPKDPLPVTIHHPANVAVVIVAGTTAVGRRSSPSWPTGAAGPARRATRAVLSPAHRW
jgi:hypothetical protein